MQPGCSAKWPALGSNPHLLIQQHKKMKALSKGLSVGQQQRLTDTEQSQVHIVLVEEPGHKNDANEQQNEAGDDEPQVVGALLAEAIDAAVVCVTQRASVAIVGRGARVVGRAGFRRFAGQEERTRVSIAWCAVGAERRHSSCERL